ncbi:MAG: hypothetical protein WC356_03170 [Candidatus Micrarchaeia archaeon]|jgi:hypothetical protein
MKYILLVFLLGLFFFPLNAILININSQQLNESNIIKYDIELLDNQNKTIRTELSIYYKHNQNIIKVEKLNAYGKFTKQLEINETGEYEIIIVDENTKSSFISNISIEKIEIREEDKEENKNTQIVLNETILLGALGIILLILFLFIYSVYKHPKKLNTY